MSLSQNLCHSNNRAISEVHTRSHRLSFQSGNSLCDKKINQNFFISYIGPFCSSHVDIDR